MGVCVRVQTCAALGPGGVLCARRVKGSGALICQLVLLAPSQVTAYSILKQTCCADWHQQKSVAEIFQPNLQCKDSPFS